MGVQPERYLVGKLLVGLLSSAFAHALFTKQEGPCIRVESVLFEFLNIENGCDGHVVEWPGLFPVGFSLEHPVNVGGFGGWARGFAEQRKLVKHGPDMRMAWIVLGEFFHAVDGR